MHTLFELHTSKNRLTSTISLKKEEVENIEITVEILKNFLKNAKIIYGIKEKVLEEIVKDPRAIQYPITVAEGCPPKNGNDGYLVNKTEIEEQSSTDYDQKKNFNLRNVMKIKSVKSGQLLASIIQPTIGIPGTSVYGNPIPAKNGRAIKLKPGKNVMFHLDSVYSTVDGQISITPNAVNVFPVFEVNGDLDLRTGNIDFIGNVIIRGNVPTGYTVKAGGDIKVIGLVEGATLVAGGSISITGGIAGGSRGHVEAAVSIYSNYLNQASCKAGNEIVVDSSILHSKIECGGQVICKKGHIIGGQISALKSIQAVDFGNHHYMQTILYIGDSQKQVEEEIQVQEEIKEVNESLRKLYTLADRLNRRLVSNGSITTQEKILLEKQKVTVKSLQRRLFELEERLQHLKEEHSTNDEAFLKASGVIFPNTQVHFGKYSKPIQNKLQAAKIYIHLGEIISVPI